MLTTEEYEKRLRRAARNNAYWASIEQQQSAGFWSWVNYNNAMVRMYTPHY
jgi:hypothetical protein